MTSVRLLRAATRVATGVAVALGFVTSLVLGAALHLDLPAVRRVALATVNRALEASFAGRVQVDGISRLTVFGVSGLGAHVDSPEGRRLLQLQGARLALRPGALLRSLLGGGDVRIEVASASVDHVDADVARGPGGDLLLVHAFDPRPGGAARSGGSGGRGVRVAFQRARVSHAWIHGDLSGTPLDAEATIEGAFAYAPEATTLDVRHLRVLMRGLPAGVGVAGDLEGRATVPGAPNAEIKASASFDGAVSGVPTFVAASASGKHVDAVVEVPVIAARRVRSVLSEAPIYAPVSLHAEAHGEPSDVHATARATAGRGELDLDARASLTGPRPEAFVRARATALDLSAFAPAGPPSSLNADAAVHVRRLEDGSLTAHFDVDLPPGRLAAVVSPRIELHGDAVQANDLGHTGGVYAIASGLIQEEGAPTTLEVQAEPTPRGEEVKFDVRSEVPRLDRVRRFGALGPGSARVELNGRVRVGSPPEVEGALHAQLTAVHARGADVGHAEIKALARGPLNAPTFEGSLLAEGVAVGGYRLSRVDAATGGDLDAQDVRVAVQGGDDAPSGALRALLGLRSGLAVHDARLHVERHGEWANVSIAEAAVQGRRVEIRDLVVDGLGAGARASLRRDEGGVEILARSEGIDLRRVGVLLAREQLLKGGRLSFDVGAQANRAGAQGHARLDAHGVRVAGLEDADLDVDLQADGGIAKGSVKAALKDAAGIELRSDAVHLGGGDLAASTWRKTWGKVDFRAHADAAKVAAMIPPERLPVSQVSGQLSAEGVVARDSASDETPLVRLSVATRGLVLGTRSGPVKREDGVTVLSLPRSRVFGLDAQADLDVDGASGFTELSARLVDRRGALVGVDAKSAEVPYKALIAGGDGLTERLFDVPFSMTVTLPPGRRLEELPPLLALAGASGSVWGNLDVSGSLQAPQVNADLRARDLRIGGVMRGGPLEGEVTLRYDGREADGEVHVRSRRQELLGATAHADAPLASLLRTGASAPWAATAEGKLARFPLATLSLLADRQVDGYVSGEFSVNDLHRDARAAATLALEDVQVGTARYGAGQLRVNVDGQGLAADARLEQLPNGYVQVDAKAPVVWGSRLVPTLSPTGALDASLSARSFRAAALLPFVQGTVNELDGQIDGDATFSTAGGAPRLSGTLTLADGILQSNLVDESFHGIRAKVTLTPQGDLRVEDASLEGPSGRASLSAGAHLSSLALASADARLSIKKSEAIPLTVQGTSLGTVYGDVRVKAGASPAQGATTVDVTVPDLHVELPLTSPSSVMDLDPAKEVSVGTFVSPTRFLVLPTSGGEKSAAVAPEKAPKSPTATTLRLHLGDDVEVRRGTMLRALLGGDLVVSSGTPPDVSGQIRIKSGTLTVQGKKFDIERGTVTFVEGKSPDDPQVSLTAGWTAEDGTRVYADFAGPLKTGKVSLRSEPGRPKNEIVSLIVFGTADGSQSSPYATPQQDNTTRVGTAAGSFATEGLTKGLDRLTGMEITTTIDTSNVNPRPEVEVQVAKDISVQLAFVLGTPPPGQNPDTTYITVGWRFVRSWTLDTTFGNLGSTMADVVWRHRY